MSGRQLLRLQSTEVEPARKRRGFCLSHSHSFTPTTLEIYNGTWILLRCWREGKHSSSYTSYSSSAHPRDISPSQFEGTPVGSIVDIDGTPVCTCSLCSCAATASRRCCTGAVGRRDDDADLWPFGISLYRSDASLGRLRQEEGSPLPSGVSATVPNSSQAL